MKETSIEKLLRRDTELMKKMLGASELVQPRNDFTINISMPKSLLMESKKSLQTARMLGLVQDTNRIANLPGMEVALRNWSSVLGAAKMGFVLNDHASISVAEEWNGVTRVAELSGITATVQKWISIADKTNLTSFYGAAVPSGMETGLERYLDSVRRTFQNLTGQGIDVFENYTNVSLDDLVQADELVQQNMDEICTYFDECIIPEKTFGEIIVEQVKNPGILRRIMDFSDQLKQENLFAWVIVFFCFIIPTVEYIRDSITEVVCETAGTVLEELPCAAYDAAEDNMDKEYNQLADVIIPEKKDDESEE